MVCLFCKNERAESDEHPFAAPLGEVHFIVRTLCKPCDDILGADVDSQGDLDARLSHARHSAGLPVRAQSILSTDPASNQAENNSAQSSISSNAHQLSLHRKTATRWSSGEIGCVRS